MFTAWGFAGAALWLPANCLALFAIHDIGLTIGFSTWAGCSILVSFAWGLALGEDIASLPMALSALAVLITGLVLLGSLHSDAAKAVHAALGFSLEDVEDRDVEDRDVEEYGVEEYGVEEYDDESAGSESSVLSVDDVLEGGSSLRSEEEEEEQEEEKVDSDESSLVPLPLPELLPPAAAAGMAAGGGKKTQTDAQQPDGFGKDLEARGVDGVDVDADVDAAARKGKDGVDGMGSEPEERVEHHMVRGLLLCVGVGLFNGTMMVPLSQTPEEARGIVYVISFSIGVTLFTPLLVLAWAAWTRSWPAFHVRVVLGPGLISGVLWSVGNACATYATLILGLAVGFSLVQLALVVSGVWGWLLYNELSSARLVAHFWLSSIIILSGGFLLALSAGDNSDD